MNKIDDNIRLKASDINEGLIFTSVMIRNLSHHRCRVYFFSYIYIYLGDLKINQTYYYFLAKSKLLFFSQKKNNCGSLVSSEYYLHTTL